jgi:hypothetical protein
MANEGKDLRDNTRALNNLAKAILSLSFTLHKMEQNRLNEQKTEGSVDTDGGLNVKRCTWCSLGQCVTDVVAPEGEDCVCCKSNHEPENSSGS